MFLLAGMEEQIFTHNRFHCPEDRTTICKNWSKVLLGEEQRAADHMKIKMYKE